MPVKIAWLVEGRVSYFHYVGDVTMDEMREASQFGITMLESSTYPLVHTIQDTSHTQTFPSNVSGLIKTVGDALSHPQMGWMVSVGLGNDIIRFASVMVSKVTRIRHRILSDIPETLAFLQSIDETLPALGTTIDIPDSAYIHAINMDLPVSKQSKNTG